MTDKRNVAILESYYGGSHAAFVDTFVAHSRHRCRLATLPARKWKWRMRGAAIWFARNSGDWLFDANGRAVDLILCSDMLSAADLRALLPPQCRAIPIACYFHENQLTYPLPDESQRDFQFGMTNVTSCLAADAVWFNSQFHRDDFLSAAAKLLHLMPDCVPEGIIDSISVKSEVLPPPVDVAQSRPNRLLKGSPTILWCHRWEFDKNPEPFFEAVLKLDRSGRDFKLVLLGEQFRTAPSVFADSWPQLEHHIVHAGFIPDRESYLNALSRCDFVISTAIQENFGIAVAEAVLCGCRPLLPNRLAYPELIPPELHESCLYEGDAALFDCLARLLAGKNALPDESMDSLQNWVFDRFGCANAVARLDQAISNLKSGPE